MARPLAVVLKDVYARPVNFNNHSDSDQGDDNSGEGSGDSEECEWFLASEVFSPEDLGVPTQRRRRYSLGV